MESSKPCGHGEAAPHFRKVDVGNGDMDSRLHGGQSENQAGQELCGKGYTSQHCMAEKAG